MAPHGTTAYISILRSVVKSALLTPLVIQWLDIGLATDGLARVRRSVAALWSRGASWAVLGASWGRLGGS